MPNHTMGSSYVLPHLLAAYQADPQSEAGPDFLLHRDQEILALVLRHKFSPKPGEIWIPSDPVVAEWGQKLASLKDKKTLPLYYSDRGRTFYTFRGHHLITGDTEDPNELAKRKAPVALSRIVFVKQLQERSL